MGVMKADTVVLLTTAWFIVTGLSATIVYFL
jgi:hypothetical protein